MIRTRSTEPWAALIGIAALALAALGPMSPAQGAPPVVKTVPWVATNPLIPHDTWSGKTIRLKGTSDVQGGNIQYSWDFGDGSPVAAGTVTNRYAIEASHAYTGAAGTVFTARLTVQDITTGETGSSAYYVKIEALSLPVEVNVAIDEGLWYLHKTQRRTTEGGVDYGDWTSGGGAATYGYYGVTVANLNAFEVNGHLETGDPSNPYTETVRRCLRRVFTWLTTMAIGNQTNGLGTFNPDTNANNLGVRVNQSYAYYQGGMFMDAIIASGTPTAITTTGPTGVIGRQYGEIVQDMADAYCYCEYDGSPGGGWRYNCNEYPDNSACQWGAIGLIAAERTWSLSVPQIVKDWNVPWLLATQAGNGSFGYTNTSAIWGPYASTPSGMVQMAMDGIGRGNLMWDKAETFMRNNFCNGGGAGNAVLDYYYGLFSFVKSMLLHDSNGDGIAEPIVLLQSSTPGVVPIDWYAAEAALGAPCNGVARTLVGDQNPGGYWSGHNYSGEQYYFETAWAIIMLNRTLFEAGSPVAVAKAIPNPAVAGQLITLDGSGSYHQDPSKQIVSWEWDLNNDGTYELTGPLATTSFLAVGDYSVGLRVTDNGAPTSSAATIAIVRVTTPPVAPTADAGGPYNWCPQAQPWFLDGTGSVNPDDGQGEPGQPGDFIKSYTWDLDGNGVFGDATGAKPDVTAYFAALGPGSHLIYLRVTDNTGTSFPSSGMGDLSSTATAQVVVRAATDPECACVDNLVARPKLTKVQLTWTHTGAHHYNVYRGTTAGGPYVFLASTDSTYSTFLDSSVVTGVRYYYVVREALLNNNEVCQSNEASALPTTRR